MKTYKCLNQQVFTSGEYKLVPIRHEDRYAIMQWRNEQLYHLRQPEPLTKKKQDWYFDNVVAKLFEQEQPDQILFSFLKGDECIAYGGLVHINWIDCNAEISFIMGTSLEKDYFKRNWSEYLSLIEQVAFKDLSLHKLYVYAFDLRPNLYTVLRANSYFQDAVLQDHCKIDNEFKNVVIHSKINKV